MKKLILALLCSSALCQAQQNQVLARQFPTHILYKIEEVNSKVKLTEDKKIKIGKKLFTADSLATISLTKGEPINQLKSYYTVDSNFLKPILSPEELDAFQYENNKENRFLGALKFASQLKLEPKEISEIRKENDNLPNTTPLDAKEIFAFYDSKLNQILSKAKYAALLRIIYKEQSIKDANKDWDKIKQLQLVTDEKTSSEYNQVINYHLTKNIFLDPKAEKHDKKMIEAITNKLLLQQPPVLIRANILSAGTFKDNLFSSIIKYEKETQLAQNQIDTILSKYTKLERIRYENETNDLTSKLPIKEPLQYEEIAQILTPNQVNIWLAYKNKNQADKVAMKNWKKLEMDGLTKDLDKKVIIAELVKYQLKHQIVDEKIKIYNTQEYVFLKRDIEQKKPDVLKQLDAIARSKSKGTYVKNALTW
ncbi:MAG: hypothetical protein V4497_04155 [Bacteroidota bacterium]